MSFKLASFFKKKSFSSFDHPSVYIDKNFPLSDDEFQKKYFLSPRRENFENIPWENPHLIFIIESKNYHKVSLLLEKNPILYFLSFDDVPKKYSSQIFSLEENSKSLWIAFDLIKYLMREDRKVQLKILAQKNRVKLFRDAGRLLQDRDLVVQKKNQEILALFLSFDSTFLQESCLEDFIEKSLHHFLPLHLWEKFELVSFDKMLELPFKEKGEFFYLDFFGEDYFLFYIPCPKQGRYLCLLISLLLEWLEKFVAFHPQLSQRGIAPSLWEEALAKISLPLGLVSTRGDLLAYNQSFTSLNLSPRDCLSLKPEENREIGGEFFRIKKIKIEREEADSFLILFYNQNLVNVDLSEEQNFKSLSSQELGIISGSIAHELNNPLAGILAAISLLELEDWDGEEREALCDMKISAKRCKSLVDIFLGFSRTRDHQQREGPLRESLAQALDLLRFRMIESDIRIEVEIQETPSLFRRLLNLSLGPMTLYLIFGEVLTLFNHYRLVLGDKSLKVLKALYKEKEDCVEIFFQCDFEIDSRPLRSKLVEYLIEVQGLTFEFEDNKIILSDWKLI